MAVINDTFETAHTLLMEALAQQRPTEASNFAPNVTAFLSVANKIEPFYSETDADSVCVMFQHLRLFLKSD
ncbi:hypothetical protein T265_12396 [Opisthorchis viverrini]|uniref:Uncharacterized protein n=1 Tax=Opisthorchis viverrini TaxID=6198 RepID=A0A074YT96_OPIVI|nr:hypothetical protein T265_12396 [Opisthorchis viverrini]KER18021.1 hypothetical protein T265_12396 [Opisthorchis viverrini]